MLLNANAIAALSQSSHGMHAGVVNVTTHETLQASLLHALRTQMQRVSVAWRKECGVEGLVMLPRRTGRESYVLAWP